MISRIWGRTPISLCVAVAILSVYSMVALAAPGQTPQSGELTVAGQVTVNGTEAISGATVFSDSTIATAANSSATVSLGRLGRVELLPNSSMRLSFNDTGLTSQLTAGRARLATPAGVSAVVTTQDGSVVADNRQAAAFTVDVECGNTVVSTQAGLVEMRGGRETKQVAAGNQEMMGTVQPGTRCVRMVREGMQPISSAALATLLVAGAAAIVAAFLAARGDNEFNVGGQPVVFSPSR